MNENLFEELMSLDCFVSKQIVTPKKGIYLGMTQETKETKILIMISLTTVFASPSKVILILSHTACLEARIHLILGAFLPLDTSWIHLAWKTTAWIDPFHSICFVWPSFCKITLGHKPNLLLKKFLKQAYEANTFK